MSKRSARKAKEKLKLRHAIFARDKLANDPGYKAPGSLNRKKQS